MLSGPDLSCDGALLSLWLQSSGALKLTAAGISWKRKQGSKVIDVKKEGESKETAYTSRARLVQSKQNWYRPGAQR